MIVRPRPGFETPVKVADAVNPALVVLSIVGIFLEYTPLKSYVAPFNQALDIIFVLDFVLRLVCHRPGAYFIKGYGWVDFLASLPGLLLFFTYAPILAAFKFVRIGRFFKIIRVLRFLRVFNFLKRMKSDSPWIQDRVMKIGVTIVLCMVVGISFLDHSARLALESTRAQSLAESLALAQGDPRLLASACPGLIAWRSGGEYFDASGRRLAGGQAAWNRELADEQHWAIEVEAKSHAPAAVVAISSGSAKADALLVAADDLMGKHDGLMMIVLGALVALLVVVVFYLGAVFAKDMSGVHLIIDSIEAGDLQLLEQEALRAGSGSLELESDESELTSLLKVVARLGAQWGEAREEELDLGIPGLSLGLGTGPGLAAAPASEGLGALRETDDGPSSGTEGPEREEYLVSRLEELVSRLESLESNRERKQKREERRLVVETARIITPAIARLARRTLEGDGGSGGPASAIDLPDIEGREPEGRSANDPSS
jgi:Ion transport protein.